MPAWAHPIPDLPVIGSFEANGSAVIMAEIDPRCFAEDPEEVPFLQKDAFDKLGEDGRAELLEKARNLIDKSLRIKFGQGQWTLPDFQYEFLSKEHEEIVVEGNVILIRGTLRKLLEEGVSSYQIKALEDAPYDLVFSNLLAGKPQRRVNVLWPGEESFVLDLSGLRKEDAASPSEEDENSSAASTLEDRGDGGDEGGAFSTFLSFLRQGFVHVVPMGVDHILFVLGLFLLSRKWRPLLYQVSAFTLAHTITLGLATLGLVSVDAGIVEPIIAASIVFVALENIFLKEYRPYRLIIVFGFGLIHGLGFAGALSAFELDAASLLSGLFGFNLGVEFGQLAVIALALAATLGIKGPQTYRKTIVIPGSVLIALIGCYWTIERIFL